MTSEHRAAKIPHPSGNDGLEDAGWVGRTPRRDPEAREDDRHRCPGCNTPTQYAAFSGGREYYCPGCGDRGLYPDDMPNPPRAVLLRTPEGRAELRALMRTGLSRRQEER